MRVLAGIVAAGLLLVPGPARATVPGANGLLAFESGGTYVLVVPSAGGTPQNLLQGTQPTWSPDGRRLAFVKWLDGPCAPCFWELDVYDLRTKQTTKVTDGSSWLPTPSWSPDGRRIAFAAFGAGKTWDIFSVNVDGSDRRRLTTLADWSYAFAPAWSPDGSTIAFSAGPGADTIYAMNADGTNVRPLTHDSAPMTTNVRPAWSPDGSRIAYASDRDGSFELWTMRSDGSDQRRLTALAGPSACRAGTADCNVGFHLYPSWSPDGTKIAFVSEPPARLLVVGADGSGLTELGLDHSYNVRKIEWQPTVDLKASVTAVAQKAKVGRAATWRVVVRNDAPRPATGVTLSARLTGARLAHAKAPSRCSRLPKASCRIGVVPAAGQVTLVFAATAAKPGALKLSVTADSVEADALQTDDAAAAVVAVTNR